MQGVALSWEPGAERGRDPAWPRGKSQTRRWPLRCPWPREGHFLRTGAEAGQRKGPLWWASVAWEPQVPAENRVSRAVACSLLGGGGQEGPGFPCGLILTASERTGRGRGRAGPREPTDTNLDGDPREASGPAHGLTAPLHAALRVRALPAPDRGGDSRPLEEVAFPGAAEKGQDFIRGARPCRNTAPLPARGACLSESPGL